MLFRSALAVLSPLAGMAVEMALAWRFGTSPTVDAFRIGAVFLLLGQQFLVLQILPHIIVPVFTECRAQAGEQEAWQVALSLGNVFLGATLAFALLVFIWPEALVWLFASGLTGPARETAVVFLRWFGLAYIPLVLSGLATSVLYVYGVFWLPSLAQFVSNVVMAGVILATGRFPAVMVLITAVLLASVLGAALHGVKFLPLMRRVGARLPHRLNTRHPAVGRGLALGVPLLGTFALGQWAAIVVVRVLSGLPPGSLAMFGYAFKMGLLVSLVPASLATVLFPKFAQEGLTAETGEFRVLCTRALRMALFLAVPLTACLYVLREPLVVVLFERGSFSAEATRMVSRLFGLLVLGAPAALLALFLEKMLYALEKAWLPTWVRLASVLLLTALAPVTAARLGTDGLALLLSILAWGSALALFLALNRRHGALALKEILPFTAQMVLLGGLCAWLGGELGRWLGRSSEVPLISAILACAGGFALGVTLFFAGAMALQLAEAVDCSRYLRWQGNALMRWVQGAVGG